MKEDFLKICGLISSSFCLLGLNSAPSSTSKDSLSSAKPCAVAVENLIRSRSNEDEPYRVLTSEEVRELNRPIEISTEQEMRSGKRLLDFEGEQRIFESIATEEKIIAAGALRAGIFGDSSEWFEESGDVNRHHLAKEYPRILKWRRAQQQSSLWEIRFDLAMKRRDVLRNRLAEGNLGLSRKIARLKSSSETNFLNLLDAGDFGLLSAIDRFKHKKGFKFSTYAVWWIRQEIDRHIQRDIGKGPVKIPVYIHESIAQLTRAENEFQSKNNTLPSDEELASALGQKVERIRSLKRYRTLTEEPTNAEWSSVASTTSSIVSNTELVAKILEDLSSREAWILKLRFGLTNRGAPSTLHEIGMEVGMAHEGVRKTISRIFQKIKTNYGDSLLMYLSEDGAP